MIDVASARQRGRRRSAPEGQKIAERPVQATNAELPQRIESAFRAVEDTLMVQWKTAAEEELAAATLEGPVDEGRREVLMGVQGDIDGFASRLKV